MPTSDHTEKRRGHQPRYGQFPWGIDSPKQRQCMKKLLWMAVLPLMVSGCGELSYKRGASTQDLEAAKAACQSAGSEKAAEQCLEDKGWTVKKLDDVDLFATAAVSPDNRNPSVFTIPAFVPVTPAQPAALAPAATAMSAAAAPVVEKPAAASKASVANGAVSSASPQAAPPHCRPPRRPARWTSTRSVHGGRSVPTEKPW